MNVIYSRSYGSIETDGRSSRPVPKISVPPDYHGSMYTGVSSADTRTPEQETTRVERTPPRGDPPRESPPPENTPQRAGENSTEHRSGLFSGLLGKVSAEDLIMFGLLLALLFGDSDDNTAILAVILAVILT